MSLDKWKKKRAERLAGINLEGRASADSSSDNDSYHSQERRDRASDYTKEIEEKAAIMEYDGELLKESAERLAICDFITCHKEAFKNYERILFLLETP